MEASRSHERTAWTMLDAAGLLWPGSAAKKKTAVNVPFPIAIASAWKSILIL